MRYLLYLAISIFAGSIAISYSAQAHVLIKDETGITGAIVHIIPNDDPIAGQPAELFFDVQQLEISSENSTLTIKDKVGQSTTVPVSAQNNSVYASYTFPAQEVYTLQLRIKTNNATHVFTYSQRVSRGTEILQSVENNHSWAEVLSIISASGLIVTAIIAFNRRREISDYSNR
jgi:hypothetical protein